MADARKTADAAIDKITDGQSEVLNLKSADAHAYACPGKHGEKILSQGTSTFFPGLSGDSPKTTI